MTWLEISGTVGRVAACLGFFIAGMAIFYLLTKVIYRIPEKQQLERLHEPGKFRNAGIVIFGGVAAVLFTGFFGMGLQGIIYFLFLAVLTVVTFIDMDTMEIPFMLNVIIFVMGVVSLILQFVSDTVPGSEFLAMDEVTIVSRLIGMICFSLPLYLIVLFIPEGFGGGDIKLMFAAGFLLGWKATVVGFFIGLILGGIYGVICLVRRSHGKNDHFAFGPFLSVGLAIALFCGNIIMNHYIDFIKAAMNPEI